MKSDHLEMIRVTLDAAEQLPVARRVRVLRALAEICGDQEEQHSLRSQATSLDSADKLCREFKFSFIQKNS